MIDKWLKAGVLEDGLLRHATEGSYVHQGVLKPMAIEDLAAGASHKGAGFLRRQFLAGCPHGIFPRGPIPLIAPRLEISLGSFRQKHQPCALKIGAGLVEGGGRAILLLARFRSRIETAMPLPRILIMRVASSDRDRAGVHIAVVDVPAFLAGFGRSAAGEASSSRSPAMTVVRRVRGDLEPSVGPAAMPGK
jgi:hypothetical protein